MQSSGGMPRVSVASTVLNEVEDIDSLIETLATQSLVPAEVIIVDGGSSDGTWERLEAARAKYPNLVPIRDESCRLQNCPGPIARGRNVGIAAASSEIVACADAGCSYHPDWLARLTAPIVDPALSGSLGIFGWRVVHRSGKFNRVGRRVCSLLRSEAQS